ncbi:MAG: cell wall-binding repeat-containing protein [Solirubrobacteraceae bacterium]|nr:cell wall-binding repeat-containing protein [Solirubrobacteraceae bacterium]
MTALTAITAPADGPVMVRHVFRRPIALLLACCAALALGACGRDEDEPSPFIDRTEVPSPNVGEREGPAAAVIPAAATKNTTRLPGPDPAAIAADSALAVFPSATRETRPGAVAIVDQRDWRSALAASALMGAPLRAPTLLTPPDDLPDVTANALKALGPTGSKAARGAQVIRVGTTPRPAGLRFTDVTATGGSATAAAIDSFLTSTRGTASREVLVVSGDDPAYAMPAAAWAAKSGDPILFTGRDNVPPATLAALRTRRNPKIYVLGPTSVISEQVQTTLDSVGTVARIQDPAHPDPIHTAIAFARFSDDAFGWGVEDPGHGLVFARSETPLVASAAAAVSAAGTFGPLLLLDAPGALAAPIREYLLDIQPGYQDDPVRGVYNHGWIAGDTQAISLVAQAEIDGLLEIVPVKTDEATSTTTTTTPTPTTTTSTTTTTTTPTQTTTTPTTTSTSTTSSQLSTTPPTTATQP